MNDPASNRSIGYWAAVSIGVGGMVGGGIFAVLGLSVQLSNGGAPLSFAVAGLVALITAYSYARLSVTYPSQGGTVEFLNQGLGTGLLSGSLNILLWLSYIVMLSLYAYAFGSYGASFLPEASQGVWRHVLISAVILLFTFLNVMGARVVGRSESYIVAVKIIILLVFLGTGVWSVSAQRLEPTTWSSPLHLIAGGMIIFLAYEGFELIANTAENVSNPRRTLPLAYFSTVLFVIALYILVTLVTVGNLAIAQIVGAKDYALAEAARPFLGSAGFTLIAVAALLSTGSAINATLYGSARVSYVIAKEGELPEQLEHKVWKRPVEGLLITGGLTLLTANVLNLSNISTMGSAGFLLIFAAVNLSNARLSKLTNSRRWIPITGFVACLIALCVLIWQRASESPTEPLILIALVGSSFIVEYIYRRVRGRQLKPDYHTEEFAITRLKGTDTS